MIDAIKRLVVRGAPAIGVAGALGVALAARRAEADRTGIDSVRAQAARIRAARPTAVNLAWAVDRVCALADRGAAAVEAEAVAMIEEDIRTNESLGRRGADVVLELVARRPVRVQTHCNAGGLACIEWGTALGIVRALHEMGQVAEVYADETRPLLQGARLTAYEIIEMGLPVRVVADGAGPSAISTGRVDVVIVGADRIAANGDTANKIGTYPLALAAKRAGIPFIVAAPESTVDVDTPDGGRIEIEERSAEEILGFGGVRTTPEGAGAWNPAFDVTPADLVTAIVTDARVVWPGPGVTLHRSYQASGPTRTR